MYRPITQEQAMMLEEWEIPFYYQYMTNNWCSWYDGRIRFKDLLPSFLEFDYRIDPSEVPTLIIVILGIDV